VGKCEIDLAIVSYSVYSEVDNSEKCEKVSQSAIKCDRIGHMTHFQAPDALSCRSS
jgi:hypothetical protein